jgi:hypothetical protein
MLFFCAGGTFSYPMASYMGYPQECLTGFRCSGFASLTQTVMMFFLRHMDGDLVSGLIVIRVPDSLF